VQDEYPELRRPHLDQHSLERRPSISRHQVQDIVQELEDKVTCHQRRAQEEKERKLEELVCALYTLSPYEQQYAVLYAQCTRHFPNVTKILPKPKKAQDPSTFFTNWDKLPPPPPPQQPYLKPKEATPSSPCHHPATHSH